VRVDAGGFDTKLVLIHSIGARSGAECVNPAPSLKDAPDRLVIASSGRPDNPRWYRNLHAHPAEGVEKVTAVELDDAQYAEAWRRFDAESPIFAQYRKSAGSRVYRSSRCDAADPLDCATSAMRPQTLWWATIQKGARP
jgi:deazaflavin-dependent oxidoreductase (nitroreductase family)